MRSAHVLFTLMLLGAVPASAQTIARLETAQGVVSLQKGGGKATLAAVGTELTTGDVVSTMKDSTALIVFTDQTQIAMRPFSRIVVSEYVHRQGAPTEDRMVVRLVKGGVRALTGIIAKRPDGGGFHLTAAGATMGQGATDFIARICDRDCVPAPQAKERSIAPPASASGSVGKVAAATGTVTASSGGVARPLVRDTPIFEKDVIESAEGGTALLTMTDGSHVQVKSRSRLTLASYRFDAKQIAQSEQHMDLGAGGVRYESGTIGKLQPTAVQVRTVTATVGIRGTEFDAACAETEAHGADAGATGECGRATYLHMYKGRAVLRSGTNEREFTSGQTGYVPAAGQPPALLARAPAFLTGGGTSPVPSPAGGGTTTAPAGAAAGAAAAQEQALYVASNEGQLVVQRGAEQIVVNRGEGAVAPVGQGPTVKLAVSPPLLDRDPFLSTVKFLDASCFDR